MNDVITWSDDRIEQLKKLWEQGLSASAIGKVLGVSKNAVVGKAHRLKLPARPSPIRRGARPQVKRVAVLPKPLTMPGLRHSHRASPISSALASLPPAPTVTAPPTRRAVARGVKSCLWPVGDPGAADFHFCGSEVIAGKSYCATHCAKAYIHKSRADSEAA
jgi:GcrA cell cycle regulator